jgi:hypothetical protein
MLEFPPSPADNPPDDEEAFRQDRWPPGERPRAASPRMEKRAMKKLFVKTYGRQMNAPARRRRAWKNAP